MDKLLVLGTDFGSSTIVQRAKNMGIYTIVTDGKEPAQSKAKLYSDEYWMIDTKDIDSLEKKCRDNNINAIISGASDFNCGITIKLCERLNLPCYCDMVTWNYSINKIDFKNICREFGVNVAKDYYVSDALTDEELSDIDFPVVVKPIDQSGNVGVSYCYNKEELRSAYRYAQTVSKHNTVIVEQMLCGQEYNAYYVMADGEISLINAATEHHETGFPTNLYSIITSISFHIQQFNTEINPALVRALKKMGCRDGIGWVEIILNEDGKFYAIEMGHRFGSDMMCTAFDRICNFDINKWMIECALGVKHYNYQLPSPQLEAYRKCVCSYGFFSLVSGKIIKIEGLEQISQLPGVTLDFIRKEGDYIERYRLMGEVVFATENCEEMIQVIKKINTLLKVKNEKLENIVLYYTNFSSLSEMYYDGLKCGYLSS